MVRGVPLQGQRLDQCVSVAMHQGLVTSAFSGENES